MMVNIVKYIHVIIHVRSDLFIELLFG